MNTEHVTALQSAAESDASTSNQRLNARIRRTETGSLYREYQLNGSVYHSIDTLTAALEESA